MGASRSQAVASTAGPSPPHHRRRPLSPIADATAALPGDTALRTAAIERAEAAGLPSPEAEEWRYSRVDELDLDRYELVTAAPEHPDDALPEGEWCAVVTLVDGWVTSVEVNDDAVAVTTGDDPALGAVMGPAHDSLAEWSQAVAATPVVLRVGRGVTVAAPVLIRSQSITPGGLSAPRVAVVLEDGAEASVVELQSSGDHAALVLPLVELDLGPRSRLSYTTIQQHGPAVWQMANQAARVAQEATLTSALVALGGEYSRVRTDCRLEGRGATGNLQAAYFGEADQTLDFRTFQDHMAPDTTSDLLFKGAVGGRSRSIYTGLITVRPEARGTNAFQTNRNLKLSEEAWAESVPNLEIQNNDVHCSHASTVGPIDDEQRFYLESRGVPPEEAERLVVSGFFADVLARMPAPDGVVASARQAIEARLDRQSFEASR